jgi:hypothetical protein
MEARKLYVFSLIFIALFAYGQVAAAQAADLGRSTGSPTAIYHGTDLEQVDTTNGNLHINLPLLHLPGRGIDTDIVLSYNSKIWQTLYIPSSEPGVLQPQVTTSYDENIASMGLLSGSRGIGSPGWSVGVPRMGYVKLGNDECISSDGNGTCLFDILHSTFLANTGTRTALINENANGQPSPPPMWSFDGSFTLYTNRGVTFKDGTVATFSQTGAFITSETLTDTNGNFFNCSFSGGNLTGCVDTLGRHITYAADPVTGLPGTMTYSDSSGTSRNISFHYSPYTLNYPYLDGTLCIDRGAAAVNTYLLTSITLANGLSYAFQYQTNSDGSTTGELTRLTLPMGGYIRYLYGFANASSDPNLNLCGLFQGNAQNRIVINRIVSPDGNASSEQLWSYSGSATPNPFIITVTDPQGGSQSYSHGQGIPLPYQVDYKDSSGKVLKSVLGDVEASPDTTVYFYNSAGSNYRYKSLTTILPDTNQQSKVTFTYGAFNNITEKDETNWGQGAPGPVIRKSTFSYLNDFNSAYAADAVHILDRIKDQSVCDGGNAFCSQSTTSYDTTAIASTASSPVVNHDYTNYPYTNSLRGNPSQISRVLTGGNVITANTYNDVGNLITTTDPNSNITSFSYTDNFANGSSAQPTSAYITNITMPTTNGISHIIRSQYYFNTGLTAATCGENFPSGSTCATNLTGQADYQSVTYDLLGRPATITKGDGGGTTITYNEAALPINIGTSTKIDGSHNLTQTTVYDGLGRVSQTQLTSDPSGTTYQMTKYDSLGRKSQVFNPTRCNPADTNCGEATWGYTSFGYDGLSRVTSVASPDGGVTVSSFTGNSTTVTDQAGKQRRSTSDGLGRLIEMDEPGGAGSAGAKATASVTISGAFNSTWVSAGSPHLAATGTALASLSTSDGSSHDFYFDTNQHLCQMSWFSGSGWFDQDLTSITESSLPLAGSSIAAVALGSVIHVFYQGANQHIYDMNWTGSIWQNLDMTVLTGASPVSNTKMAIVATGSSNTPMMFYEGTNQHLFCIYWNAPTTTWLNADLHSLSGATNLIAPNGAISAAMWGTTGNIHALFLDTNQNLNRIVWSGTAWITNNLTSITGAALAVPGSKLTTISTGTPIDLMTFYEGAGQHIYSIYWNNSAGTYQALDFTVWSGATNIAAVLTSLANNPVGPHMFYLSSNQHLDDMLWNGSAWVNADLTALANTTAVPASGSSLSSHGTSGGNTYNIFFEGGNQHIYHTYFSPSASAWFNEDPLVTASNFVVDSGTVSLSIPNGTSNFAATVCYGYSTNPFCTGKPVNASSSDIANALAAVLNGAGSPVNATVTGTTLNLTWRTLGWNTATVAPMASTSDNTSLFPSGSFTSTSGSFTGGIDPGAQSLTNPLVTLYQYDGLDNLTCVEQHGTDTTGTGCSAPTSSDANSTWRVRRFVNLSICTATSAGILHRKPTRTATRKRGSYGTKNP